MANSRIFGLMGNALAGGIYVVAATKDGTTEYWAVATVRDEAVAAVLRELPSGWSAIVTDRRLSTQRIAALKMRPNSVRKL